MLSLLWLCAASFFSLLTIVNAYEGSLEFSIIFSALSVCFGALTMHSFEAIAVERIKEDAKLLAAVLYSRDVFKQEDAGKTEAINAVRDRYLIKK